MDHGLEGSLQGMTALERRVNITAVFLPFIVVAVAVALMWGHWVGWSDVAVFALMYLLSGYGVTVGFHRMLTHRAFQTHRLTRYVFAILGSLSVQGPVIDWVADHRKHHAHTDVEGDPHSPHVGHGAGISGALKGLAFAHVGWLMSEQGRAQRSYLWGGLVRVFLLHHVTWSINSVCHFFGTRRFSTDDESRNVFWLALLSFGEAWHHNHHAFPTSAFHGLRRWEALNDPAGWVIRGLERLGLVWNVRRVSPDRQRAKAIVAL